MMKKLTRMAVALLCSVSFLGCFNPDDYDKPPYSSELIYFLSSTTTDVLADGVSSADIVIGISEKASPGKRTVVFKASSGSFVGGKGDSIAVTAIENFTVSAKLTNSNVTTAIVTATIQGIETRDSRTISFIKAYPEKITSVSVDSFAVSGNYKGKVTITAMLRSANGRPSTGHPVLFSVRRLNGNLIGDFLNGKSTALTDASGNAKISYSPGITGYQDYATIRAVTATKDNAGSQDSTSETTRIYILK